MFESDALTLQADLAFRLIVASALGALIGLEREIHRHPAGMRTHLLVSFGSALFTVLSVYGFVDVLAAGSGTAPDPTRIAAQVVTGIGFLGAGAIIKYGTSIRGLTTAGSLWATSAVGMAAGAGQLLIAVVGTAIVLFSLWPLNWIVERLHIGQARNLRVRLQLDGLEPLGALTRELAAHRVELAGIQSERQGKNRYEVELELRLPPGFHVDRLVELITGLPDIELLESASLVE
ncbi:MAG: MgtC/SapB family protein [Chloroflexota bacterium]